MVNTDAQNNKETFLKLINSDESGYVLIITVFFLVLSLLLFIAFYARINNNTDMSSAVFWHDQSVMAANQAVPIIERGINVQANGTPLEYQSGTLPAWYQNVSSINVIAPTFSTWKNCATAGLNSGKNCLEYQNGGFDIKAIVQPTGIHNQYVCGASGVNAIYYNVYVDAVPVDNKSDGGSGSVIQSVYRLCVKGL
jgi:hypothetical protein